METPKGAFCNDWKICLNYKSIRSNHQSCTLTIILVILAFLTYTVYEFQLYKCVVFVGFTGPRHWMEHLMDRLTGHLDKINSSLTFTTLYAVNHRVVYCKNNVLRIRHFKNRILSKFICIHYCWTVKKYWDTIKSTVNLFKCTFGKYDCVWHFVNVCFK